MRKLLIAISVLFSMLHTEISWCSEFSSRYEIDVVVNPLLVKGEERTPIQWNYKGHIFSPQFSSTPYYNRYLPQMIDPLTNEFTNVLAATGCVPTAMAQIMYLHEYPSEKFLSAKKIDTETSFTIAEIIPILSYYTQYRFLLRTMKGTGEDGNFYRWSDMAPQPVPDLITDVHNFPPNEQRDQIARLLYDVGAAMKSHYSLVGTYEIGLGGKRGGPITSALMARGPSVFKDYFYYD